MGLFPLMEQSARTRFKFLRPVVSSKLVNSLLESWNNVDRYTFEYPIEAANVKPGELWMVTVKDGTWFYPKKDLWALMRHDTMLYNKVVRIHQGDVVMFLAAYILREEEHGTTSLWDKTTGFMTNAPICEVRESVAIKWLFEDREVWSLDYVPQAELINKTFKGKDVGVQGKPVALRDKFVLLENAQELKRVDAYDRLRLTQQGDSDNGPKENR